MPTITFTEEDIQLIRNILRSFYMGTINQATFWASKYALQYYTEEQARSGYEDAVRLREKYKNLLEKFKED